MLQGIVIDAYTGDLEEVLDLLRMSMRLPAHEGVRRLVAVEQTRGTHYAVARHEGQVIGLIGFWLDPSGELQGLEPPQIIDLAVRPERRRQGVARALVGYAVSEMRQAGCDRLWIWDDGHNSRQLAFFRRLGFRLISAVPDWYGDGTAKAILRLDFKDWK